MSGEYVQRWMKKIKQVERKVVSRMHKGHSIDEPTEWEYCTLQKMKARLLTDRYMYGSYQRMLHEWGGEKSTYWRRHVKQTSTPKNKHI